ncbi:5-bromo-4-chloroindolyl phosphate hydrolysis protein [Selenomonas ruminantium]|uniref:5-bromo-4-chloroindolyl phosphate hydrolysis protein n=1 Tax=Selenomonas ruminantium TaxID=971 RepID=A0A1I3DDX2_SELRU|nr:5-bromo-4-chloroindolyl phosphate hydrolysis family protein [Selenomonas ruminantium]SFH84748.1 5-bromo-4-chloroindolyl phosphate hydrolysis protein [Selenomonas ruminantium]
MDGNVILAIGILVVIVYKLSKKATLSAPVKMVQDDKSDRLAKGQEDYEDITYSACQLRDRELRGLALALQKRGKRIMTYLRQHPQALPAARQFLDYYQDRTAALLRQCVTLEQTELNNPETQKILCQTKETLQDFTLAYEKQFAKIMNLQLNDMEAELKVARHMLEGDGIEQGMGTQMVEMEEVPVKPAEDNNWQTAKKIGVAALTVLGAVGLYKLLGNKKDAPKE